MSIGPDPSSAPHGALSALSDDPIIAAAQAAAAEAPPMTPEQTDAIRAILQTARTDAPQGADVPPSLLAA